MAGVKGKSGGPRANAGGARPGAGRKPNPPPVVSEEADAAADSGAREFLRAVMADPAADARLRVDAAKALLRAEQQPAGGKKEQAAARAQTAESGTGWDGLLQ